MARKRSVVPVRATVEEFAGVDLGDKRLDRRAEAIVEKLSKRPSASFPKLMVTSKEQEALYRFLRNDRVTLMGLIEPHILATALRAKDWDLVVVAHDSTEIAFKGESRNDLYELRSGTYGFGVHLSLAIGVGQSHPCPLGTLGATIHPDTKSDRDRWLSQALEVDRRLGVSCNRIHVMDREADVYPLLAGLIENNARFVVRAHHDRLLGGEQKGTTILEELHRNGDVVASREVFISARRASAKSSMPDERKARPPRNSRVAQLRIRTCTVTVPRPPRQDKEQPATIDINIVEAAEVKAPKGTDPVHWLLATTEPIDTAEQALKVIDIYRTRWVIEEYFKALKTGCKYETRQLEQLQTFSTALGLFIPIAWQLLLIRSHARIAGVPASTVITDNRLHVLRVLCAKNDHQIPKTPTARDVMQAIALLGGHIRQNGDPGWMVLWRGYETVLDAEYAIEAAKEFAKRLA
jgi:hypothetical protein